MPEAGHVDAEVEGLGPRHAAPGLLQELPVVSGTVRKQHHRTTLELGRDVLDRGDHQDPRQADHQDVRRLRPNRHLKHPRTAGGRHGIKQKRPAGPGASREPGPGSAHAAAAGGGTVGEAGLDEVAVHARDVLHLDALGAGGFALAVVGAGAELLGIHLGDHVADAEVALGLALGQVAQVVDLRGDEEHGAGVGAGGHAGATADAGGRIHGEVGALLGDGQGVGVLRRTRGDTDEAAGGDDAVEGAAVHHQVLDDGEGFGPPGLDGDAVAILEAAHVQLAGGGALAGAVGAPVDHHAAGAADALAAVVVEGDGFLALADEAFVHDVEHLQEGHVGADVLGGVFDELAVALGVLLPPHVKGEIEVLGHGSVPHL